MLGVLSNGVGIILGSLLGGAFRGRTRVNLNITLGLFIALMSFLGVLESATESIALGGLSTTLIIFCFLLGTIIGEALKLDGKISYNGEKKSEIYAAFMTGTLLFGIGSMQITGPITAFVNHDNSQLYLKAMIDFCMSFVLATELGNKICLSAIPVAASQLVIGGLAFLAKDFFSPQLIRDICLMGYVILFFTGLNMLLGAERRIKNANMLPSLVLIIIYNIFI